MNILNKLTIKHLKSNKKRTLVTIIGITLSTALMVGIGLLTSSFLTTERISAEENFGKYHFSINNISKENYETLKRNVKVKSIYYYNGLGFASIDSKNSFKPYIYVVGSSTELLNNLKLIEGKLPNNNKEIVISKSMLNNINSEFKVGDNITLDLGDRYFEGEIVEENAPIAREWNNDEVIPATEDLRNTKKQEYKIVGIIEEPSFEDYESAGYMALTKSDSFTGNTNVYVELKKPQKTYDTIEEISHNLKIDKEKIIPNTSLLFYYGATKYENVNNTILPLILIALSVISIGCIVVIYNSFAISTMERKKSFGLYSSIGTTGKQIKKTVLFEAIIVGLIGIVLGLLGGFIGIYTVVKVLNVLLKDVMNMKLIFSVNLTYIIIPLIFMCLVILISAYLPAKRASMVTPIEAIRGNDDIKITRKSLKTPKIISKTFGIEGELAHKNMKRNKKKYRVTIISLFISIVMFNTFTSFLSYAIKGTDVIDKTDYDVAISLNGTREDINKDIETINNNYDITNKRIIIHSTDVLVRQIDLNEYTTMWQNISPYPLNEETTNFELLVVPDSDIHEFTNKEALIINIKYRTIYEENNRKTIETKILKGDNYTLNIIDDDNIISLEAFTTDKISYGLKNRLYSGRPVLIISETTYMNKFKTEDNFYGSYIINSKDYKKINEDFKNKKINLNTENGIYSPRIEEANSKNIVLAVKILFYGFIALIVLIGVTSVINTINTSINLRRKEFAMLRSVGLTPHGFNKILFFESLFFGLKSLIYGVPVSIGINALIASVVGGVFDTKMIIPWKSLFISIIGVFIIVLISMNYASKKIKKENILEALREENI